MTVLTSLRRFASMIVLFAAVMLLWALPVSEYWINQANLIGIYAIVVVGLVLLTGAAGVTSFGQAAFVGIGAYTAGYLTTAIHLNPFVSLVVVILVTGLVAAILSVVTMRLSGHFLPLGTLAWGLSIFFLFGNLDVLGKYDGLTEIPPLGIGPITFASGRDMLPLIWAVVAFSMMMVNNLIDSRSGRAIRAFSISPDLAGAMGVDGARDRLKVFVLAAILAGVSGWLYAHLQRTVSPTPFSANASIEYLFMAVVGGLGSVWGAIVGASLILVTKDILQRVMPYFTNQTGTYELIVFGGLLVLLLQSSVGGVWSLLARLRSGAGQHAALPISHRATSELLAYQQRPEPGSEVLRVESVSKRFAGLTAVDNMSFSVGAGEILGLIGPNGAGKSTLFNIISGTLTASGGRVLLQGEDITRLPSHDIAARRLSRSFQHVKIHPDMSVLENVALGAHLRGRFGHLRSMIRMNRREETSLLTEASVHLRRVGLGDVGGQPASALALGQQRTLEIARSLAADPVLLLLDEPAAGLRYNEKQKLAALLKDLSLAGLTIVLVEHDMEFVMGLSDRIVVMEFGRKLTEGEPLEVQNNPAVIEAYLGAVE